ACIKNAFLGIGNHHNCIVHPSTTRKPVLGVPFWLQDSEGLLQFRNPGAKAFDQRSCSACTRAQRLALPLLAAGQRLLLRRSQSVSTEVDLGDLRGQLGGVGEFPLLILT
ncbi:MAG TPA: hypothetical protein VKJ01_09755, partial [Candidatus Solibacter sp.]|nr:hypothetical protein [Candidatus Solibacter sp.]